MGNDTFSTAEVFACTDNATGWDVALVAVIVAAIVAVAWINRWRR